MGKWRNLLSTRARKVMGWPLFYSMELQSSTPDLHPEDRDGGMVTPRVYQTKT